MNENYSGPDYYERWLTPLLHGGTAIRRLGEDIIAVPWTMLAG